MKITYEPELARRSDLVEIAKAASVVVEQAIGPPAERVTATWGIQSDERGRANMELSIADWSGHATTRFRTEELQPPEQARLRFIRLWGDLLEQASKRLMQELETVGAEEKGS